MSLPTLRMLPTCISRILQLHQQILYFTRQVTDKNQRLVWRLSIWKVRCLFDFRCSNSKVSRWKTGEKTFVLEIFVGVAQCSERGCLCYTSSFQVTLCSFSKPKCNFRCFYVLIFSHVSFAIVIRSTNSPETQIRADNFHGRKHS